MRSCSYAGSDVVKSSFVSCTFSVLLKHLMKFVDEIVSGYDANSEFELHSEASAQREGFEQTREYIFKGV